MNNITPNLFLIGGMRCGSTSLHLLFDQHDQINMSSVKEPRFYLAELKKQKLLENYTEDLKADLNNFISSGDYRTRSKYNTLFDKARYYKYRGESSHYVYSPEVADIIKKESPNSKIIISVRNSIDRLYSEYLYRCRINKIKSLDFSQYVKVNTDLFINNKRSRLYKGFYNDSILHWIKIFGKDNVKVVVYEEFKDNQQKGLNEIYEWLNLPFSKINNWTPQKTGKIRFENIFFFINSSGFIKNSLKYIFSKNTRVKIRSIFYDIFIKNKQEYSEISTITRNALVDFYKEDVIKLERLLKKRLYF